MTTSESPKSAGQAPSSGFERKDPYVDSTYSGAPSTEQVSAWANEFFRSPGIHESGPALNTTQQDGALPANATPAAYQTPSPNKSSAQTLPPSASGTPGTPSAAPFESFAYTPLDPTGFGGSPERFSSASPGGGGFSAPAIPGAGAGTPAAGFYRATPSQPSAADAGFARSGAAPGFGTAQPAVPNLPPYYPASPQPSLPNVLPVFPNVSQPLPANGSPPFSTGLAQPAIPAIPPFYPAVPQPSFPIVAPIPPAVSQPNTTSFGVPGTSDVQQPALPGVPPFSPALPQPSLPMVAPITPAISQPTAAGMPGLPGAAPGVLSLEAFDGGPLVQPFANSVAPGSLAPTSSAPAEPTSTLLGAFTQPALYFLGGGSERPTPEIDLLKFGDPFGADERWPGLESLSTTSRDAPQHRIAHPPYDIDAIRADFPILQERVNGRPLVWLDNAATTQKPHVVIERIAQFYLRENSNIHRAAHTLAARATDAYEAARQTVARFLNASSAEEIVFVRGTTEGINLIAQTWGKRYIEAGDEIIVTRIEHHSNIVPWQMLCQQTGAKLRVAPVDDSGQVLLEEYERLFNQHTKLVSFTQVSNALGTVLPVQQMVQIAHRYGARVVVDGAQAVCHMPVDVQAMDPDFYVFSGHKVFGPTGIGAVYGKKSILDSMPPYQGGGNMIGDVTFERTVYHPAPMRFEAGTGNIADAVGLGAALEYLMAIGVENVNRHEHELLEYGSALLREIPGLRLIGTAKEKAAVMGFILEDVPTEQVGAALASEGIAVRAGHHCAQPALRRFGVETTVRPSLALYNSKSDIDALVSALRHLQSRWLR